MNISETVEALVALQKKSCYLLDSVTYKMAITEILEGLLDTGGVGEEYLDKGKHGCKPIKNLVAEPEDLTTMEWGESEHDKIFGKECSKIIGRNGSKIPDIKRIISCLHDNMSNITPVEIDSGTTVKGCAFETWRFYHVPPEGMVYRMPRNTADNPDDLTQRPWMDDGIIAEVVDWPTAYIEPKKPEDEGG